VVDNLTQEEIGAAKPVSTAIAPVMQERRENRRTHLVSFSGIDGAGKSTQIQALLAQCESMGLCVRLITFWEDVARLTGIREGAGHRVFRGDKGVGSPSAPINRRDKNVTSWSMTLVRLFLYFIDALSLRYTVWKAIRSDADLVISDRYIYDELANLPWGNRFTRLYVRWIMKIVPRPSISFLLDADPIEARARKPEYPIEFLHINRKSYLALGSLIGMTVVPPMPIVDAGKEILMRVLREMSLDTPQTGGSARKNCEGIKTVLKGPDQQRADPAPSSFTTIQ
jgi:thymidylate kinase